MKEIIKKLVEKESYIVFIDDYRYNPERSYTGGAYSHKKTFTKISDNYWEVEHWCSASEQFGHCSICGNFISNTDFWHDEYCQEFQQISSEDLFEELASINWLDKNIYDGTPAYYLSTEEGKYWVE